MNWLEVIFHYAPDQGNGMAKALFLLASIVGIVTATVRKMRGNAAR
jgi:hypothetical protein